MPVADLQEASDLDRAIGELLAAPSQRRISAAAKIFVEFLDFTPPSSNAIIPLRRPDLPPSAPIIATREGVNVVLVQLLAGVRLSSKVLGEAVKDIRRTLPDDVFLVGTDHDGAQWQFVYPARAQGTGREVLRRMVIDRGQPRRTVVQQLAGVYRDAERIGVRAALEQAYNVEAVTKKFFTEYRRVFERVMGLVTGLPDDDERKLFCQTLFNRLLFLYFLQRKGWLTYRGDPDYLNALWRGYTDTSTGERLGNFFTSRLKLLFFTALANERSSDYDRTRDFMEPVIGDVPFLNGGLFAATALDKRDGVTVPDEAISLILHELFARFNFTITESSPFDVEVAVDPEMLGKVFEELVTGRHETGAYYTPRPVVSFMCREALKGYLTARVEGLTPEATAAFVDEYDVSAIPVTGAGDVLDALERVTVVDPACGSGAYLLGMMHELVELQRLLWSSNLIAGAKELYQLKLRVIERNVYGVDVEQFAVNIAMLRLWLSLIVEYDGPGKPPALPNLDYKITCGDSLTAPDPKSFQQLALAHELIVAYREAKGRYLHAHDEEKRVLRAEIDALKHDISAMPRSSNATAIGFDWAVEFAEVFERGGFDIVVMNPPYLSANRIPGDQREAFNNYLTLLRPQYGFSSDLYVHFLYRAIQMLKTGGILSAITSNTFLTNTTKTFVRRELISRTLRLIVLLSPDVFDATVYSCVTIVKKEDPPIDNDVYFMNLRKANVVDIESASQFYAKALRVPAEEYRLCFNAMFFEPTIQNRKLFGTLLSNQNPIVVNGYLTEKSGATRRRERRRSRSGLWQLVG